METAKRWALSVLVVAAAIVSVLAIGAAWAQTKQVTFDAAQAAETAVQLEPQRDGGCEYRVCGDVKSDDGKIALRDCYEGAFTRAQLVTACRALTNQAQRRWLFTQGFAVDAGSD